MGLKPVLNLTRRLRQRTHSKPKAYRDPFVVSKPKAYRDPFVVSKPKAVSNHPERYANVRLRHPSIRQQGWLLRTNGYGCSRIF